MRKIIPLSISLIFCITFSFAQSTEILPGNILPQMSSPQRLALVNPADGMILYDTDTESYWFRKGGFWVNLSEPDYWQPNGPGSSFLKNTHNGGIWSTITAGLTSSSNNASNPEIAPTSGAGTRLMWIPTRSAFRVGTIFPSADDWNQEKIGLFSFATGVNTEASGSYSSAFGFNNTANGAFSFTSGTNSTASGTGSVAIGSFASASGFYASAIGSGATASGAYAFATGATTTASGVNSTALGYKTTASGIYSTAIGKQAIATSDSSMALGNSSKSSGSNSFSFGNSSKALGDRSFAVGNNAIASGLGAFAIGNSSTASSLSSLSMGEFCTASGVYSNAQGNYNTASGNHSTALGYGNIASGEYSTAMGRQTSSKAQSSTTIGQHNEKSDIPAAGFNPTNRLFQIGNGTGNLNDPASVTYSNAMTVLVNGNTGINTVNPQSALEVNGFTKLGSDAPKIKVKKFTGVTTDNPVNCAVVNTLIANSKVLDFVVIVGDGTTRLVKDRNISNGYEFYSYYVGTSVAVCLTNNSGNVSEKPFRLLVTYEE
jgi:hypothetical protein